MFEISIAESLIVAIVALIVIGPKNLPKVAKTCGIILGKAQRQVADFKAEINRSIELEELKQVKEDIRNLNNEFTTSINETTNLLEKNLLLDNLNEEKLPIYRHKKLRNRQVIPAWYKFRQIKKTKIKSKKNI